MSITFLIYSKDTAYIQRLEFDEKRYGIFLPEVCSCFELLLSIAQQ
ncbi:MAG: hypothetical protein ACJA0U_000336 [Salibacteraceae bacterium]|jgi:hypothetical protein